MARGIRETDFPTRDDGSYDPERYAVETAAEREEIDHDFDNPMRMGEQLLLNAVRLSDPPAGITDKRWDAFVDSLVSLDTEGLLDSIASQIAELQEGMWRGRTVTEEDIARHVPDASVVADREALAALASIDLHFPHQLAAAPW